MKYDLNEESIFNEEATEPLQNEYGKAIKHLEIIIKYYYDKYNWLAYRNLLNPENKDIIMNFLNNEYNITFQELERLKIKYNVLNNNYNKYYKQKSKRFDYAVGTALGIAKVIILAPFWFIKGLLKK